MGAPKHPKIYDIDTPPRYTRLGGPTEKNVRGLADRRGLRLLVQPGRPGFWRLQDRDTGIYIAAEKRLDAMRKMLVKMPTTSHKIRRALYGGRLRPHPWTATR